MPGAFWQGGYFGIYDEQGEDEFSMVKLFRFLRFNGVPASILASLVDGDTMTFDSPLIANFIVDGLVAGLNLKARAISPIIYFPDSIITTFSSMTMAWNEVSER
jgi:hypothetical protein